MFKRNNKVQNLLNTYLESDSLKERAALENRISDSIEKYLKESKGLDYDKGDTFYYPDAEEGEMGSLQDAIGDGYIEIVFHKGKDKIYTSILTEDLDV